MADGSNPPSSNERIPMGDVVPTQIQRGEVPSTFSLKPVLPGESVLDFINKNLRKEETQPIQTPQPQPVEEPKEEIPVPEIKVEPKVEEKKVEPPKEEKLDLTPETETPPEAPTPDEKGVGDSLRNLRKKFNETKALVEERDKALKATTEELEKFRKGDVLPEVLEEKEAEIAHLRRFQKIVDLKMSPEYDETFTKPLTQIESKLSEIAKDYNLPDKLLKSALTLTNKADLNRFLEDHFDSVGALEVKALVLESQGLKQKAVDAEKDAEKSYEDLRVEQEKVREVRKREKLHTMSNVSRDAWAEALGKVRSEGKALELIYKDGDPEHNEKYVKPVLQAAAKEYGKIVTMLAENGLENLPKDLAFALSRMCQLAHASATSLESRAAAIQHVNELSENVKRTTKYERPSIGGGTGGGGVSRGVDGNAKPLEAKDVGKTILSKIGIG